MDTLKSLVILPICLLAACAPPKAVIEQHPMNPAIKQAANVVEEPTTTKKIPVEKRKAQTKTVGSWEIRGAMAAKSKSKGWSASMNWVQNGPNSYQIRLMGPLGAGTVLINKKGSTITFQDGPKKVSSNNASELLQQQTGIRLPVDNLYYWVRGLPAPGSVGGEKHDQYNHLIQLKQSGYNIDFSQYTSVKGIDLPGVIRLEGNGVMVKVVVKNWSI